MPQPDRLQKRKEEYKKLYEKLGNIKSNDRYADEKNAVRNAFGMLNQKLDLLTNNKEDGDKKLEKKDIQELVTLYEETMRSLHALNEKMGKRFQHLEAIENDEDANLTSSQKKEYKSLKQAMDTFDLVTNTVSKDISAFYVAANKDSDMSVRMIYESSRKYSGYTVKEGQQLSTDAGNSNVRTAITLIDENGEEVEGYFTQDANMDLNEEKELRKSYDDNCKKFGPIAKNISYDTLENLYYALTENRSMYSVMVGGELLDKGFKTGLSNLKSALPKDSEYDLDKLIGTPEKFRVFSEMLMDYAKISNRIGIAEEIKMSKKGNINRRNSAMSAMAKLLGCDDVIAESKNVRIKINGKEIDGTFMKKAKGLDCHKEGIHSDLMRLTPASVNNLKVKQQLADLQVLDYLCGNPDRHMGNLTYICEKDKNGKVQLTGIQGIDNDSSFGKEDFSKLNLSSVQLDNMRVITESTAKKILNMSKETLVNMFYEYELDGMEIDNMAKRLETLQKKIKEDDKVYAQGYGKGTLIDKRIKMVDESELNMMSLGRDLSANNNNLFGRILNVSDISSSVEMAVKHSVDECRKSVKKLTSDSLLEFTDLMSDIAADDRKFQTGSSQYTAMRKSTKDVLEALRSYTGPDIVATKTDLTYNDKLKEIQKNIDKAIADCESYKTYKHERNITEGKQDFDPRPHKLSRAERRWKNVDKTLTFLKKQKEQFKEIEKSVKNYEDTLKNKKEVKEEVKKISDQEQEQMYPKIQKQRDMIKYDNYRKRSQYVVVEEAIKLKDAVQYKDLSAQAEHHLQFNIKVGYAIHALKPEDRPIFRKNIESLTNMKLELDDEQLFKRGVASRLVHEKLKLMVKEKNGKLNSIEKQTLANLKDVKLKSNSNGYDDLMKNPAFERFYEKEKAKLDINSPQNAQLKEIANGQYVSETFNAAMAAVGLIEENYLSATFEFRNTAKDFSAEMNPEKAVQTEEPKKEATLQSMQLDLV